MNSLAVAGISFTLFVTLEWVFWLSPAKQFFQEVSRRANAFWWIQPYYLIRLFVFVSILLATKADLWPVFSGGVKWLYSLGLGLCLVVLSFLSARVSVGTFWRKVRKWYSEDRSAFLRTLFYIVVYPGFVEELLFRWYFTAMLWTSFGWWTVVAVSTLNMTWHLPYWIEEFGFRSKDGWVKMSRTPLLPASIFAMALTAIALVAHNLVGSILAHAFGDWAGAVVRATDVSSLKVQE